MQYPKLIDRKYIQLIFHPQLIPRGATWIQCYNTSKNNCCMSPTLLGEISPELSTSIMPVEVARQNSVLIIPSVYLVTRITLLT